MYRRSIKVVTVLAASVALSFASLTAQASNTETRVLPDSAVAELSALGPAVPLEIGETFISGGTNAPNTSTPWVAFILAKNKSASASVCTGALIAPQWVLTAKHCFAEDVTAVAVAFGAQRTGEFIADNLFPNPSSDAALLHLQTPVSNVLPVQTATQIPNIGQSGSMFGWGGSNAYLQMSNQTVTDWCKSQVVQGSTQFATICDPSAPGTPSVKTASTLGQPEHGDSGGPLVIDGALAGTLIGGGSQNSYFVPVASIGPWIQQHSGVVLGQAPQTIEDYPYESRIQRIAGANRVETALIMARQGSFTGDSVIVATGLKAPDALGASGLAGNLGAPILLTVNSQIDAEVTNTILALGKRKVMIIGGGIAFSPGDQSRLTAAGISVEVLAGADRFATAQSVASKAVDNGPAGSRNFPIFLVDAASDPNVPDALSTGAIAARQKGAILLSSGTNVDASTVQAARNVGLQASTRGMTPVFYAVGGRAAQAAQAAGLLQGNSAQPANPWAQATAISGADRYETAAQVAGQLAGNSAQYLIASGTNFPDGLTSGAYAATVDAAVLLSNPASVPAPLAAFLRARPSAGYKIIGGPAAISRAVANELGSLLK
ncbi:MAG: cell wall-binding repeat-containing protein [Actinomycetaceae bacterium]|nr:cell wall-binding repeat-containing protein [Actinomycetaceae bacterium]